jgi:hypothetical protein
MWVDLVSSPSELFYWSEDIPGSNSAKCHNYKRSMAVQYLTGVNTMESGTTLLNKFIYRTTLCGRWCARVGPSY